MQSHPDFDEETREDCATISKDTLWISSTWNDLRILINSVCVWGGLVNSSVRIPWVDIFSKDIRG